MPHVYYKLHNKETDQKVTLRKDEDEFWEWDLFENGHFVKMPEHLIPLLPEQIEKHLVSETDFITHQEERYFLFNVESSNMELRIHCECGTEWSGVYENESKVVCPNCGKTHDAKIILTTRYGHDSEKPLLDLYREENKELALKVHALKNKIERLVKNHE